MKNFKKLRAVFFGTPEFCIPVLKTLQSHPLIDLCLVVSMPDRPAGRGNELKSPPVVEYCKDKKITYSQSTNINQDKNLIEQVKSFRCDLFIVLAFAQFLNKEWLAMPSMGAFNIHTSLLPRWRGAAPIQHALLNGDKSTGVSIQRMVIKMDAGDVALFKEIEIFPYDHLKSLSTRLQHLSSLVLGDFIDLLLNDKIVFQKQDESKVTFAPEVQKESGHINFKTLSADEIMRKYLAYYEWPGVYLFLNKKRLKVLEIQPFSSPAIKQLEPGEGTDFQGQLIVACKEGFLRLLKIQLEGKTPINDYEFLRNKSIAMNLKFE